MLITGRQGAFWWRPGDSCQADDACGASSIAYSYDMIGLQPALLLQDLDSDARLG